MAGTDIKQLMISVAMITVCVYTMYVYWVVFDSCKKRKNDKIKVSLLMFKDFSLKPTTAKWVTITLLFIGILLSMAGIFFSFPQGRARGRAALGKMTGGKFGGKGKLGKFKF